MGLLDFYSTYNKHFAVHLRHSSFWPLTDVKPMPNDLVRAMSGTVSASLLYICVYNDLYDFKAITHYAPVNSKLQTFLILCFIISLQILLQYLCPEII